jgi:hypothetical protein
MDIEEFISKFLDKIAKTKGDSLLFGGLFVGFALGMAIFGGPEVNFDLIGIFEILIISMLLFLGVLLIVRGKRTIYEEDFDILQDEESENITSKSSRPKKPAAD